MVQMRWVIVLMSVVLLAGLTVALPRTAHAASVTPQPQRCVVTQVILNGTQPPTMTCLRTVATPAGPHSAGQVTPDRFTGSCDPSVLVLYQDANYGGDQLCIKGGGLFNLTAISRDCLGLICWTNWNDTVSSFSTGTRWGHFAWNIGNGGAWYYFSPGERVPYIGNTWNDQVSSVEVDGP